MEKLFNIYYLQKPLFWEVRLLASEVHRSRLDTGDELPSDDFNEWKVGKYLSLIHI